MSGSEVEVAEGMGSESLSSPVLTSMSKAGSCRRARLIDINEWITCFLCGGYLIDATTLVDCSTLHSFCKSCILKYVQDCQVTGSDLLCPVCETGLNHVRPHLSMRLDRKLQEVVYKLVPGLFKSEMKKRREFYARTGHSSHHQQDDAMSEDSGVGSMVSPSHSLNLSDEERGLASGGLSFLVPEDKISLSLEYAPYSQVITDGTEGRKDTKENRVLNGSSESGSGSDKILHDKRFLRCNAGMPVSLLKKFLVQKFGLDSAFQVELLYGSHSLTDDLTLIDVIYIYNWCSSSPMRLFYRIQKREVILKRSASDKTLLVTPDKRRKVEDSSMESRGNNTPTNTKGQNQRTNQSVNSRFTSASKSGSNRQAGNEKNEETSLSSGNRVTRVSSSSSSCSVKVATVSASSTVPCSFSSSSSSAAASLPVSCPVPVKETPSSSSSISTGVPLLMCESTSTTSSSSPKKKSHKHKHHHKSSSKPKKMKASSTAPSSSSSPHSTDLFPSPVSSPASSSSSSFHSAGVKVTPTSKEVVSSTSNHRSMKPPKETAPLSVSMSPSSSPSSLKGLDVCNAVGTAAALSPTTTMIKLYPSPAAAAAAAASTIPNHQLNGPSSINSKKLNGNFVTSITSTTNKTSIKLKIQNDSSDSNESTTSNKKMKKSPSNEASSRVSSSTMKSPKHMSSYLPPLQIPEATISETDGLKVKVTLRPSPNTSDNEMSPRAGGLRRPSISPSSISPSGRKKDKPQFNFHSAVTSRGITIVRDHVSPTVPQPPTPSAVSSSLPTPASTSTEVSAPNPPHPPPPKPQMATTTASPKIVAPIQLSPTAPVSVPLPVTLPNEKMNGPKPNVSTLLKVPRPHASSPLVTTPKVSPPTVSSPAIANISGPKGGIISVTKPKVPSPQPQPHIQPMIPSHCSASLPKGPCKVSSPPIQVPLPKVPSPPAPIKASPSLPAPSPLPATSFVTKPNCNFTNSPSHSVGRLLPPSASAAPSSFIASSPSGHSSSMVPTVKVTVTNKSHLQQERDKLQVRYQQIQLNQLKQDHQINLNASVSKVMNPVSSSRPTSEIKRPAVNHSIRSITSTTTSSSSSMSCNSFSPPVITSSFKSTKPVLPSVSSPFKPPVSVVSTSSSSNKMHFNPFNSFIQPPPPPVSSPSVHSPNISSKFYGLNPAMFGPLSPVSSTSRSPPNHMIHPPSPPLPSNTMSPFGHHLPPHCVASVMAEAAKSAMADLVMSWTKGQAAAAAAVAAAANSNPYLNLSHPNMHHPHLNPNGPMSSFHHPLTGRPPLPRSHSLPRPLPWSPPSLSSASALIPPPPCTSPSLPASLIQSMHRKASSFVSSAPTSSVFSVSSSPASSLSSSSASSSSSMKHLSSPKVNHPSFKPTLGGKVQTPPPRSSPSPQMHPHPVSSSFSANHASSSVSAKSSIPSSTVPSSFSPSSSSSSHKSSHSSAFSPSGPVSKPRVHVPDSGLMVKAPLSSSISPSSCSSSSVENNLIQVSPTSSPKPRVSASPSGSVETVTASVSSTLSGSEVQVKPKPPPSPPSSVSSSSCTVSDSTQLCKLEPQKGESLSPSPIPTSSSTQTTSTIESAVNESESITNPMVSSVSPSLAVTSLTPASSPAHVSASVTNSHNMGQEISITKKRTMDKSLEEILHRLTSKSTSQPRSPTTVSSV